MPLEASFYTIHISDMISVIILDMADICCSSCHCVLRGGEGSIEAEVSLSGVCVFSSDDLPTASLETPLSAVPLTPLVRRQASESR